MIHSSLAQLLLLCITLYMVNGMAVSNQHDFVSNRYGGTSSSRRAFLSTTAGTTAFASVLALPSVSNARYILNEETGEYDEVNLIISSNLLAAIFICTYIFHLAILTLLNEQVTDEDWQTTWNKRIEKAKSMSTDEVFLAAQGAGNVNLKDGEESEASKKRRALAGCRNAGMREKSGMMGEKECTAKVLGGDYQFMIDSL